MIEGVIMGLERNLELEWLWMKLPAGGLAGKRVGVGIVRS